jgi:mRNA-degrading endonuclease YafQ of YafQ-DinJ toxin-antitoxin module
LLKKSPEQAAAFSNALKQLSEDAFHPSLKSHKLRGDLQGLWSCSAGYDLRIVFEFVVHEGQDAILLVSAGTHDDVY